MCKPIMFFVPFNLLLIFSNYFILVQVGVGSRTYPKDTRCKAGFQSMILFHMNTHTHNISSQLAFSGNWEETGLLEPTWTQGQIKIHTQDPGNTMLTMSKKVKNVLGCIYESWSKLN